MKYIEAVGSWNYKPECEPYVFMCGGITNCPDWQQDFVKLMESQPKGTLLNPRRADFPIGNPNAAREQITWEYNSLWASQAFIFWFSYATIQPIVLFELGARLAERRAQHEGTGKRKSAEERWIEAFNPTRHYSKEPVIPILIGIEEDYAREQDVRIQTDLVDPNIPIVRTLEELAGLLHEEVAKF